MNIDREIQVQLSITNSGERFLKLLMENLGGTKSLNHPRTLHSLPGTVAASDEE